MATISIFLRIFFENIEYILPVGIVFLLITLAGVGMTLSLLDERKLSIVLPAGMATGIFVFIIFLGIFSYSLKGRTGILIIFVTFLLLGLSLLVKNFKKFPKIKIDSYSLRFLPIYIIIAGFISFLAGANIYGGDVIAYWGFATSFANGNYPLRSPWQPDLLANHHQGTFLFEGAVHGLTGADMLLIHTTYSVFVVLAGFFLVWGVVRKITKRDFLSLLAPLVTFFSVGAIFIPLPGALRTWINPEVEHVVNRLPLFLDAKNRLGGSSNLPELIYINHRAAAFLGLFLIVILVISKLRIKEFYKPILIAALSIAAISSDEIILPSLGLVVTGWFVMELISNKREWRTKVLSVALGGAIFVTLFFVVGNALRDSMLTPPKEEVRFQLVLSTQTLIDRMGGLKSAVLRPSKDSKYFWYLPDLRLIAGLAFIAFIFTKNRWSLFLFLSFLGALFSYFSVTHTYYPANYERFLHPMYQLLGLIASVSFIMLLSSRNKMLKAVGLTGAVGLLLPSVIFAAIYLYGYAKKPFYPNLYGRLPDQKVLVWVRDNLGLKRVFFVDGYLRDQSFSYLSLYGIQNYGLFIPISPADIKVHTPDFGIEAIDIINTLNPSSLEKLKVEYLFVVQSQLKYYTDRRLSDLKNSNYFSEVYSDELGTLYKIKEGYFKEAEDQEATIARLPDLLGTKGNIYIDYPPRLESSVRAVMTLALKDKGELFTEWRHGTFNYIETKIKINAPSSEVKYDYLILGPETDPREICGCKNIKEVWKIREATAYEVI
ncbi:hypothetical protein A2115_03075 [Candidatus Woesebacteria bacterium GWA1_41_8]|uniref:Uncharacterized protein n=1 Tax=Candidatus Woesebacteria bacterium GWA1_41_8 TaxID=1802471 RepID=A0A1F7WJ34_9BACT|nr:MAG: hypothetical protein A2115_03075 [Candidatus Woesebacteria bacterium GWA1_41_8]